MFHVLQIVMITVYALMVSATAIVGSLVHLVPTQLYPLARVHALVMVYAHLVDAFVSQGFLVRIVR